MRVFVEKVARPGRFELPTLRLEGRLSIQLCYGLAADPAKRVYNRASFPD
jgi:hypothetical protein